MPYEYALAINHKLVLRVTGRRWTRTQKCVGSNQPRQLHVSVVRHSHEKTAGPIRKSFPSENVTTCSARPTFADSGLSKGGGRSSCHPRIRQCIGMAQGRFYVGAGGGAQAPPNVGQAPPNILVPTAKIRIVKI